MPDPSPVDPQVAAALVSAHLADFFQNSPRVSSATGWDYEITGDPLVALVHLPARPLEGGRADTYTLRLDASCYDTWPVSATFVERHDGHWRRARLGTPAFPLLLGSPGAPPGPGPGFQFALHDEYPFATHPDQLICFSYNLGYYLSGHTPAEGQAWRPGKDRLDATLNRIHAALQSAAYAGPSRTAGAA